MPVANVSVSLAKYAGKVLVPQYLARVPPERITDGLSLRDLFGFGGRFKLTPLGANGRPCNPPLYLDVPNEDGSPLDLNAPMPEGAQAAPTGAAPGVPGATDPMIVILKEQLQLYKDIADRSEKSRSADFQTMLEISKAMKGGDQGGGFYATELTLARSRIADLEGKNERLATELVELRMRLMKRTDSGRDTDDSILTNTLLAAGAEKLGLLTPGTADKLASQIGKGAQGQLAEMGVGAAAGGTSGIKFSMPSAEKFAEEVASAGGADAMDRELIRQMVKLHKVGAMKAELWAVVEPVAAILGVL